MNTPRQKHDLEQILAKVEADEDIKPPELGFLVDQFKIKEAERLLADKTAAKLKAEEVRIKLCITAGLRKMETTVGGGISFKVELTQEDQPTVKDWTKFQAYILKTKDFSLLERRPGKAAIKERWDDGKAVPGIDKFPVDKLSFTKLKG